MIKCPYMEIIVKIYKQNIKFLQYKIMFELDICFRINV